MHAQTTVLVAEDDDEDYLVVLEGMRDAGLFQALHRVKDGAELLDFLYKRPPWTDAPEPSLLLLDLNMPRVDGREALQTIRSDPDYVKLPIAVLTSSQSDEDLVRAYGLGVLYYVRKPVEFAQILDIVRVVEETEQKAPMEAYAKRMPRV
jgi:two-component system response regulator